MDSSSKLSDLRFQPTYYSNEHDIKSEVIIPLLKQSKYYDRAVGFFTSGWLEAVADGMAIFASNGGTARIITSPKLQKQDWEAILTASAQRQQEILLKTIQFTVKELLDLLKHQTLAVLSWLISDGILKFRFAIPRDTLEGGDYHPKVAFFRDDRIGWCLHGSMNDSEHAFKNVESVSVFSSVGQEARYYREHFDQFEKLWKGTVSQVLILEPTSQTLSPFLELTERFRRPYSIQESPEKAKLQPRDYQIAAVEAWEKNGRRGIFEMATGTGKTLTAIHAVDRAIKDAGRLAVFILAPYLHLVQQWMDVLTAQGIRPIPCYGSKNSWYGEAQDQVLELEQGIRNQLVLAATHKTAASEAFRRIIKKIEVRKLLIGDEVHGLGARWFSKALEEGASWRLGLSATPQRWYDDQGTKLLNDYFGPVLFEFPIDRAIKEDILVSYRYHPILINLTHEELAAAAELGRQLALCLQAKDEEKAELIARKRARLINSSENILPAFLETLRGLGNMSDLRHILVYCAPGKHREALSALARLGIRTHEFIADTPAKERKGLLSKFAKGEIQALVAMKCLDEGVDVPETKTAFLLASSTNPREFVQRRGRILRKSAGKSEANIYDFLTAFWDRPPQLYLETARSLAKRCLPRFAEFAADASNCYEARKEIFEPVSILNLISSLDKRPWELYRELKSEDPFLFAKEDPEDEEKET